jgi:hypothetical protein
VDLVAVAPVVETINKVVVGQHKLQEQMDLAVAVVVLNDLLLVLVALAVQE